ncbi:hypothetical protein MASR1M45_07790 [Candidatus Kapaibacterium sp.]
MSRTKSFEVGFFLRYDSQKSKIFADFFIGKSEELWLDLNINTYQKLIISVVSLQNKLDKIFNNHIDR